MNRDLDTHCIKITVLIWLGWRDSDARNDGVKVRCLTAWLQPNIGEIRGQNNFRPRISCMGWIERFELSASRATIWRANQLRYTHHIWRAKRDSNPWPTA